jgi:uncharacterized small protein (DUF1192 family)
VKPPTAPPDTRSLVAQARSAALVAGRAFDTYEAQQAAERAAKDLTLLVRLHSVFKITRRIEWYRDEIARLRR